VVFGAVVCQALSARPENKEVLGTAVGDTECIRTSQATASLKLALGALGGVSLVVFDHHLRPWGLSSPAFVGGPWQRCLGALHEECLGPKVPRADSEMVACLIRTIFALSPMPRPSLLSSSTSLTCWSRSPPQ